MDTFDSSQMSEGIANFLERIGVPTTNKLPPSDLVLQAVAEMKTPHRMCLAIVRPHPSCIVVEIVTTTSMSSRSVTSNEVTRGAMRARSHLMRDLSCIPGVTDIRLREYGVTLEIASACDLDEVTKPVLLALAIFCAWLGQKVEVIVSGELTESDQTKIERLLTKGADSEMCIDFSDYQPVDYPEDPEDESAAADASPQDNGGLIFDPQLPWGRPPMQA